MKYNAPFGSSDPNASYADRSTPGATSGSKVPAKALEQSQRELVALIAAAGITPSDSDLYQVAKAIQTGKVNFATAGGTANALTATLNPAPSALTDGMEINLKITSLNTGPATLNPNGLGPIPIKDLDGAALVGGELVPGMEPTLRYDGTNLRIVAGASIATLAKLLAAAGTVNLAQTGALDMANGLQLRWGAVAGAVTATFHHAFSHGAYMAIATAYSGNTGGPDVVEVSLVTTTTLTVVTSRGDTNATYTTGTWWYLAIGY